MALNPSAGYSLAIRFRYPNRPGMLGEVASAIGDAGGDIASTDIVEETSDKVTREINVRARDAQHGQEIARAVRNLNKVTVVSVLDRVFQLHQGGKIEIRSKTPLKARDDLSMAYTPGVARVCSAIKDSPDEAYNLTIKRNTVAVLTDGTAVLGLGDIGPEAALPVMEGKAMLFKEFAGVDAFPICVNASCADDVIKAAKAIAPVFGGINLEDIAAPRCFEVEDRLKEELDIPVFHDDQHGTAVVVLAALLNALEIVGKKMEDLSVVISGAGAAGVACSKIMLRSGIRNIVACDRQGAVHKGRKELNFSKRWLAENINPEGRSGSLSESLRGADVFLGVSAPGLLKPADLDTMARDPIVFALANPTPEIMPEEAAGHARIIATGRSDYPNQINNVLCFPGFFRGLLDCRSRGVTEEMKLAAARAIASVVEPDELREDFIIPSVFNDRVGQTVAEAVSEECIRSGYARVSPESLATA